MKKHLNITQVSNLLQLEESEVLKLIDANHLVKLNSREIDGDSVSSYLRNLQSNKKILTRRQFITGLSLIVGSGVAILEGTTSSVISSLILKTFDDDINSNLKMNNSNLITSIFGNVEQASWSTNIEHLLNTYGLSDYKKSSTYLSAKYTAQHLLNNSNQNKFLSNGFPGPVFIDGDIVSIGGPISDPIARRSFEYTGSRYQQVRNNNTLIDLPILYDYSIINDIGKRYISGSKQNIKNGAITIDGKAYAPPTFEKNGFLKSDYLLITRIPNIINENGFNNESSILIIGGIHGTGTEAIKLILEDKNLLLEISNIKKNNKYFQSLFYINDIHHLNKNGENITMPLNAIHVVTKILNIDNDKILRKFKIDSIRNC